MKVVEEHQQFFLPVLDLNDLPNFPGALGSMIAGLPDVPKDSQKGRSRNARNWSFSTWTSTFRGCLRSILSFVWMDVLGMFVIRCCLFLAVGYWLDMFISK